MSPPTIHTHQEENPFPHGSHHVSLPRTHTHQERLRDDLERTHTHQRPLRDYNDSCRARGRAPPDHYYRDLGILHSRCDQLSLALAESRWGGRSPVIASQRVPPPSDAPCHPRPDSSSLQGPCLSPWLGPSPQDRHRPRDASSDLSPCSRLSKERYHEPFVPSARHSDNRRLRSRESLSPNKWESPSRGSPSLQRMGFASRGSPSPSEWIHLKGFPLCTANGIRFKGVPFFLANGIRFKEAPSPKRMGFASRGSPSPQRMGFSSRGSPPPK